MLNSATAVCDGMEAIGDVLDSPVMLHPAAEETVKDHSRCKRCRRELTNTASRLRGYGPECWAIMQAEMEKPAEQLDEEQQPA